ncbi:MAG: tryptophan 2,3-dioxygenase family protein [Candidatus Dormibacteraeota bacterium]|nr:tryptophan 2,3-dioxygenase family protein [Candidatus Dormibacteraeota bacterium]
MDDVPPAAGGSAHFGEDGRRLDYGSYLRIPELLRLQSTLTGAHDELLFIVVHQVYELWFRQLLHELEAVRDRMAEGDHRRAHHYLRRVAAIERLLVQQVEILETMSPQDFLEFRAELAPASGFQSVQFREIEFISGLKDAGYLGRLDADAPERARLDRRLAEPTLWDAFLVAQAAAGAPPLEEIYRQSARHGGLFDLCEGLLDHDQAFALWRARHVLMVERQIGGKTGTGGSTGAKYLRSTLDKRFFPELWDVRSKL